MARLLVLLPCLLVACGGDDDGPPAQPDAGPGAAITYAVTHYDIALDLPTRDATVTATLAVASGGECITIGFAPDTADSVLIDNQPAKSFTVDATGDTLTACSATSLASSAQATLAVTANVPATTLSTSDVGFSTTGDHGGGTFTYMVSWVGGCSRHGICDAAPDQFPTYHLEVTHPTDTQVLCSGVITATPDRTTCEFAYAGGPTYSTFAIAARKPAWMEVDLGDWGGVHATLYDVPGSNIGETFDTENIKGAFLWLRDHFGAYPYGDELRFFVGPTYWAGFEHPGNIALSETLATPNQPYIAGLTHTVIHEMVHQWAGDHATLAGTYDFVWKEAMAEYLAQTYADETFGPDVSRGIRGYWKLWSGDARYYPVPLERPALFDYYGDAYGPGPLVLFYQLEVMSSRAQVLDAIASLIGGQSPRTISIDDVKQALAQFTGFDLDTYFDGWVLGEGKPAWPRAVIDVTDAGGGMYTVSATVTTSDGKPRPCAFDVRLTDGVMTQDVTLSNGPAGGPYMPVTVSLPFVPNANRVLDPDRSCIMLMPTLRDERQKIEPWRRR